jgi:glycosyltransferase involved in cell wall biosynthesis
MTQISVVIPCHNEAGTIQAVLEGVAQVLPDAEWVVIDDGSTDGTSSIVEQINGVRLVRLEENAGKGVALSRGISEAKGELIVFIDGDGQDDPADLPALLAPIEQGAGFTNGSKFIGKIERGAISGPNFWGNRMMSFLINLFFGGRITDSQSGFRAMLREVAEGKTWVSTEYEIETEMLCHSLKRNVKIVEVPVTRKPRGGGSTGFRRVRNGLRILWTILRERLTR